MPPRKRTRSAVASLVALALAAGIGVYAQRAEHSPTEASQATQHDYYVMALSWSPSYCLTQPDDREQCGGKGYGFVLHGLWPQYEDGGGPERCSYRREPDRATVEKALAFMPSRGLVRHEWREHGSCSGLEPPAYFEQAGRAYASFDIPDVLAAPQRDLRMRADELRAAVRRENEDIRDEMMRLHCRDGRFVELRVCLDRDLSPRPCGKRMRNACPVKREFIVPAAR